MVPSSVAFNSNDNTVGLSEALEVASSFASSEKSFFLTRSSDPTVKEAFSIKDTDGLPLFHVVNYEDGGFVLVAGDNRLQPVQAYSTKGKFTANKAAYPFGLKVWMESVQDSLRTIKNNRLEQDNETQAAWRKYSEDIKSLMATRSLDPESGLPPEADTIVGPFITDSWHQAEPYNMSLTEQIAYYSDGVSCFYYTPVIGCKPLAIARIMRYHQYPTTFSWNNMPDNTATSTTKSFLKNVHDAVKSYANLHNYPFNYYYTWIYENNEWYLERSTSVNRFFPIGSFMCSQYGYAAGTDISYSTSSYNAMKRDLIDHGLPCIISGGNYDESKGHSWICDGYHYIFEHWLDNNNEPIGVETTFLHYCWGQYETDIDTWYNTSNVSMYNMSFNHNMRLAYHLSPVDYWDNLPEPIN